MKFIVVIAGIAVVALAGCATTTASDPAPISTNLAPTVSGSTPDSARVAQTSGYVSQTDYEADPSAYASSNVVLFFRADWCSECRETDKNLKAAEGKFPAKLVVVNIDYDDNRDLKKQYGVTHQHTFVHIAADGTMIKKWSGSFTPQDINAEIYR